MTREAKKKIVIENYFKSECDVNTSIKDAFIKGFELGLKKAPQEPRWIPVSERLPEEGGDYLVTICYDLIGKGTVREVRRNFFCILSKRWLYEDDEVLAWMPLPKSYEEVEE